MSWMKTITPVLFLGLIAAGQPASGQLDQSLHNNNGTPLNELLIVDTLLKAKCSPPGANGEGTFWTSMGTEKPFDLIEKGCQTKSIDCCPFCDRGLIFDDELGNGCSGSCCSDIEGLKSCGHCCNAGLVSDETRDEGDTCNSSVPNCPAQTGPRDSTGRPQAGGTVCDCTECDSTSECSTDRECQSEDLDQLTTDKHYAMAQMVEAALRSAETKPQAMKTLINAMVLIERQTQMELKAEVAQLQLAHEREMAELRGKLIQSSAKMVAQGDSDQRLKNWLGPIYTNLNQNMQQLSLVVEDTNAITKSMNRLEQKMSNSKREQVNNPNLVSNPYFSERFENRPHSSQEKVFQLQARVKHLEHQLKNRVANNRVINNIQSDNQVQPAKHLQPIFKNEVLNPLYDDTHQRNRSKSQPNPIREELQPTRRSLRASPQSRDSIRNR